MQRCTQPPGEGRPASRAGALLALLTVLACAGVPAHQRAWIRVRTVHFEITSGLPQADTIALARDLELFRSIVHRLSNAPGAKLPVPTRIYLFADAESFRAFRRDPGIVGSFVATPRANFVAAQSSSRSEMRSVLQHEYAHVLLRSHGTLSYPPWYDEGFAELLSTVEVSRAGVEIGRIPQPRLQALRRLPWVGFGRLLRARSLEGFSVAERATFYAQSWALVHYLLYGRDREGDSAAQLTRYLTLVAQDVPYWRAMEEAFGVRPEGLERELRSYLARGRFVRYTLPLEHFEVGPDPAVTALSSGEVAAELGGLALATGAPEHAEWLFRAAVAGEPTLAAARTGLGAALRQQGRWEEAAPHYREALERAPDDAQVHLDYAEYLYEGARQAGDAETRAERLRAARRQLERSWELAPEVPAIYAMYGATHLLPGEDPSAGLDTLEHAHRMLHSDPETTLLLAETYLRLDRRDEARRLVMNVLAWSHGDSTGDRAHEILDRLDSAVVR